MSETATQEKLDALAPYSEVRAEIEKLKTENAGLTFDYESKAGNKAARSHIYTLRQRKAEVDRVRKAAGADALDYKRKVDAVGKEIIGEIEQMIAVHEKPLKEIEEREEARKQRHRDRLVELQMPQEIIPDSKSCRLILERIEAVDVSEGWDEFAGEARATKEQTVANLKQRLAILEKQEADAAELQRLRKENEERLAQLEREEKERKEREAREAKEREERIAREAAEKAKREAEEAAERKRAEEEAARKAEAEKAMAEARRKEQEAQAAIEAERKKAEEAKAEAEHVKRMAQEREAELAAQAKRQREEEERRKADQQHREKVMAEAAKAIELIHGDGDTPGDFERALKIVTVIAEGRVPHTSIKF